MTDLRAGALHVWRIDVRRPRRGLDALLSEDELDRASRFRFERDRDAFVCTRAALRTLTASYLGIAPRDVAFGYGAKGKPEVDGLSFNASHAGDAALVAFSSGGRLGVDVEVMRTDVELRPLARRFFTRSENAALDALPPEMYAAGFYRCWTRKEAFVKALGEGLSFELDRVEVSVHPDPARILSVDGDAAAGDRWTMRDVPVGEGYAGAVASDVPALDVVVRDWSGPATAAA